jgi:hypothetical protein
MGYKADTWRVAVRLSNHNSERDYEDAKLWGELQAELRKVIEQEKYQQIMPLEC